MCMCMGPVGQIVRLLPTSLKTTWGSGRPSHYAQRMIACYEGNKAKQKTPRIRPDCDTSLVSASCVINITKSNYASYYTNTTSNLLARTPDTKYRASPLLLWQRGESGSKLD